MSLKNKVAISMGIKRNHDKMMGVENTEVSLKELYKQLDAQGVEKNYIRSAIYKNLKTKEKEEGLFIRTGKKGDGFYKLSDKVRVAINPETKTSTLIVEGDGRNLNMIRDNSVNAIITDHPWSDKKSHKAGNQKNFANDYEKDCFQYNINDINNKYRVLKKGSFCVEILPQKNSSNASYLRKVEEMYEKAGFDFFAETKWVKGELKPVRLIGGEIKKVLETAKINTGRTVKDVYTILIFTKGKARKLRPFKMNIKKKFNELLGKKEKIVEDVLEEILVEESFAEFKANNFPLGKENLKNVNYSEFSSWLNKVLKDKYLKNNYCMSGAREILPSRFIHPEPKNKIHQAEKPVSLYQELIKLITKKRETILDQFAGSGGVGKAAMEEGRNSILVEIAKENVEKMTRRLNAFDMDNVVESLSGIKNGIINDVNNEKEQLALF